MQINLPTMLTLIRMVVSPLVLPFLLVYLMPLNFLWLNSLLAALFVLLAITDFFDGYLARQFKQVTQLGKILDPIADKFLSCSTILALLAAGKLFFAVALLLIGREFFVTSLRLIALEHGTMIAVSLFGKLKTIVQMTYLAIVILNPYHQYALAASFLNQLESLLLLATVVLTLWSAYRYYCVVSEKLKQVPGA